MGIAATAALNALIDEMAAISEGRPPQASPIAILLPEKDEEDSYIGPALGPAEGQSFIIEYKDAAGQASTRRITVISIRSAADGSPALYAKCHERKAMRNFRADRIVSCIDYDGEVFSDVNSFLVELFGAERFFKSAPDDRTPDHRKRWNKMRQVIQPHAVLLAALSASDDNRRRSETTEILNSCAHTLEAALLEPTRQEAKMISAFIRRLEPDRAAIAAALDDIYSRGPAEVTNLLIGAIAVMDADGKRDEREVELINNLAVELTGMPIA
ncbi:WYL domain-containing protein [Roseibium suaedae]|uniref:WYL domain-containing protein n=1 Tax=Roseibium suaedae TaxID=735517 RepID=A0A1M7PN00_9HYPH|nr:WYL domain-containing protein [Roseibium suaedae]SHN18475.1 hypothetical protein SAMN05444272_4517 [Roseibium suaedae]